jgi:hypothetical protein
MFDGVMLAHDLIERVSVESGHEEEYHARALPPVVLPVLSEEQSRWERYCDGLSRAGTFETYHFADAIAQGEQCQKIQEGHRALGIVLALEVRVGQVLEYSYRIEREGGNHDALNSNV